MCITLRDETEWSETVNVGWNNIVGNSITEITEAVYKTNSIKKLKHPDLYGNGNSAKKITDILLNNLIMDKTCAA
ncbi:MAG: hypothetical protein CVV23_16455 [Ignavibacteriae bacterium HGW-Ignavibacteriae-2]|nr:MAG: hypothetical protein CVV23_16455 [Ignavibacteriae bacterium HGW-Ignavibacteriae-2]